MTIVLDTNVLVSGMISPDLAPGRILDLIQKEEVRLVVDDRILQEYEEVLRRPYFRRYYTAEQVENILAQIFWTSTRCVCTEEIVGLPDPDDAHFAEVAVMAGIPLVTGNVKHFPANLCIGIEILTPSQFIVRFHKAS